MSWLEEGRKRAEMLEIRSYENVIAALICKIKNKNTDF